MKPSKKIKKKQSKWNPVGDWYTLLALKEPSPKKNPSIGPPRPGEDAVTVTSPRLVDVDQVRVVGFFRLGRVFRGFPGGGNPGSEKKRGVEIIDL